MADMADARARGGLSARAVTGTSNCGYRGVVEDGAARIAATTGEEGLLRATCSSTAWPRSPTARDRAQSGKNAHLRRPSERARSRS